MRFLIPVILILASCSASKPKARSTEELRQSVQAAIDAGNYARAEKDLSELVAQDPKSFDSLIGRAAVRIFLGDAQGSETDLKAAVALDPEKGAKAGFEIADGAIWRAREFDMKGRKAEALKIYNVLLKLYPKSGMAYHDRGGLKIDMKDYDGAIADLTKAIEFDEGNNSAGDSFVLRSRAERAKGDVAGAGADEAQAKAKSNETKEAQ